MNVLSYRKLYQDATGVILDRTSHVHHLDGNRWNISISNLVCIPAFIHWNYHKALLKAWNPSYKGYASDEDLLIAKETLLNCIKEKNHLIDKLLGKGVE